jgi:hypothetical protein
MENQDMSFNESQLIDFLFDLGSDSDISPSQMGTSPLPGDCHFEESYVSNSLLDKYSHVNQDCVENQDFIQTEEDFLPFPTNSQIKKQVLFRIVKKPRKAGFHGRFKRRYLKFLKRIINMSLYLHGKNLRLKKIPKEYAERVSSFCEKPTLKMTLEQFLLDQEFVKWNLNENCELLKEMKTIFEHFLKVKLHFIIKSYFFSRDYKIDKQEILKEKGQRYFDEYKYHSKRYVSYFLSSNENNGNRSYIKRNRIGLRSVGKIYK